MKGTFFIRMIILMFLSWLGFADWQTLSVEANAPHWYCEHNKETEPKHQVWVWHADQWGRCTNGRAGQYLNISIQWGHVLWRNKVSQCIMFFQKNIKQYWHIFIAYLRWKLNWAFLITFCLASACLKVFLLFPLKRAQTCMGAFLVSVDSDHDFWG